MRLSNFHDCPISDDMKELAAATPRWRGQVIVYYIEVDARFAGGFVSADHTEPAKQRIAGDRSSRRIGTQREAAWQR